MNGGKMVVKLIQTAVLFVSLGCAAVMAQTKVHVEGLMNKMAVLKINGTQRILRVGQTSPEGVKLVSSNSKEAVVIVDGERQSLGLSGHISGSYQAPKKATVSIQENRGQYITSGSVNGRPVRFLVDTGATSVTMSMEDAKQLGVVVDRSKAIYVGTAGGRVIGYPVVLNSVKVGGLKANYIRGVVLESGFTGELLLGMTFLEHVDIRYQSGFLILEQNL
jgi:aspartyl protease family protein